VDGARALRCFLHSDKLAWEGGYGQLVSRRIKSFEVTPETDETALARGPHKPRKSLTSPPLLVLTHASQHKSLELKVKEEHFDVFCGPNRCLPGLCEFRHQAKRQ
jgi:hypothetical protein